MNNEIFQVNTFDGGMNLDVSPDLLKPNQIRFGKNLRYTVDNDSTLGSLESCNSNKKLSLPVIPSFLRISPVTVLGAGTLIDITISVRWTDYVVLEIASVSMTKAEVFNAILSKLTQIVSDINTIYPGTTSLINDGFNMFLSCTGSITERFKIGYLNIGSSPSTYIKNIIGSTELRDKTILYTITDSGLDALLEISVDHSEELISKVSYIGILNFSTEHPIRDSVSNYESDLLRKIYFTDGNNPLRSINIGDPNLQAKASNVFDMVQSFNIGNIRPFAVKSGGTFDVGRVQYSYQQYNSNGQETAFSNPSFMVDLAKGSLSASTDKDYEGGDTGEDSNKQVSVIIENLDPLFDSLRVVSIFYPSYNDVPIIKIVRDVPTPQDLFYIFDDNNSAGEVITQEQLVLSGSKSIICKTLSVKNNLLLLANIEDKYEDYTDYDFRAYRYNKADKLCSLSGNKGLSFYFADLNSTNIEQDADCIIPKLEQFTYKYGKNKTTNVWQLGGAGKNISYNFIRKPVASIYLYENLGTEKGIQDYNALYGSNYSKIDSFWDLSSPLNSGMFQGYMRNEVYRFGIQFYDEKGRKTFVNWIGDIKFPDISEVDTVAINMGGVDVYDYRTAIVGDSYPHLQTLILLGIEFHIDKDSLPKDSNGFPLSYSIVRVKREDKDKTEIMQGLISGEGRRSDDDGETNGSAKTFLAIKTNKNQNGSVTNNTGFIREIENNNSFKEFISPEIIYGINGSSLNSGKLRVSASMPTGIGDAVEYCYMTSATTGTLLPISQAEYNPFIARPIDASSRLLMMKPLADYESNRTDYEVNINAGVAIPGSLGAVSGQTTLDSKLLRHGTYVRFEENYTRENGDVSWKGSIGTCGLLSTNAYSITNADIQYDIAIGNISNNDIIQYNGSDFFSRRNNEYISCNNIEASNYLKSSVIKSTVFGGDTFVNNFFHIRMIARRTLNDTLETKTTDSNFKTRSHMGDTVLFPVESSINLDVNNNIKTHNTIPEYELIPKSGVYSNIYTQYNGYYGADATTDSITISKDLYLYNTVFSKQSDLLRFQAKPYNFNSNQIFDSRIISSSRKINGEVADNWLIFPPSEFIDLQNQYGSINKLIYFNNNIMAWQDSAIGVASIDEKATVPDNTGSMIILGTGGILKRYDYVSITSGSKNQFSITKSPTAIYYYDTISNKLMLFSGQEMTLSETKGVQSLLNSFKKGTFDNESLMNYSLKTSVLSSYDYKYRNCIFTFNIDIIANTTKTNGVNYIAVKKTLIEPIADLFKGNIKCNLVFDGDLIIETELKSVSGDDRAYYMIPLDNVILEDKSELIIRLGFSVPYNELVGGMAPFLSNQPILYSSNDKSMLEIFRSSNSRDSLYLTNSRTGTCNFYGNDINPKLSFVLNDNLAQSKVLDSISASMDVYDEINGNHHIKNPFVSLRCHNNHYNSGWTNVVDYGYTLGNKNEVQTRKYLDNWTLGIPRNACKYTPQEVIDNNINLLDEDTSIDFNRKYRERIDGRFVLVDLIFKIFKSNNPSTSSISTRLIKFITSYRTRF